MSAMDWLAHSAKNEVPAQTYGDHILRAVSKAREVASCASQDMPSSSAFTEVVELATEFHDMGKLDDDNQDVLKASTGHPLPREHADAGTKHLFDLGTVTSRFAGMLAYSHHRGLPDVPAQEARGRMAWRADEDSTRFDAESIAKRTGACLPDYLAHHEDALGRPPSAARDIPFSLAPIDLRLALSCLAEADHGDTARHYGAPSAEAMPLRATERLGRLDAYVASLGSGGTPREVKRAENRLAHYKSCRDADTTPSIVECDSPVGSGKTTAVMAHLLRAAHKKNLRRVFVVQPFTNIIDQSVDVYRRALVLNGESPDHIVAAHHHKTDFADPVTRALTTRWQTPVVVTTAVQFFETLASNQPASLRKLHQVARSAIFIDEAHAALPAHLWPLAWRWLRYLAKHWGCHVVLASGSLARFWTMEEFYPKTLAGGAGVTLPTLLGTTPAALNLRSQLSTGEAGRVQFRKCPDQLALCDLLAFIGELPGPRIAVFNTVQTAAVVALAMARHERRMRQVEHLSTALNPSDRARTLARIKARLADKSDTNWTLVATSLVEAGVDLSFASGVREASSLSSLMQLGGRVNRHDEYDRAEVWSVRLSPDSGIQPHPAMQIPASVLDKLFKRKQVTPDACTHALKLEVNEKSITALVNELFMAEATGQFTVISEKFKVIASDTVTAITPGAFLDAIKAGAQPDWKSLQNHCVQIWATKAIEFGVAPIQTCPGLYAWNLDYDDFIGYMAGALGVQAVKSGTTTIV